MHPRTTRTTRHACAATAAAAWAASAATLILGADITIESILLAIAVTATIAWFATDRRLLVTEINQLRDTVDRLQESIEDLVDKVNLPLQEMLVERMVANGTITRLPVRDRPQWPSPRRSSEP